MTHINYPTQSSQEIRRNWGWWDGRSDAQRNRYAEWYFRCDGNHPDPVYGKAYFEGYDGLKHPNTGLTPDEMVAAGWGY